MRAEQLIRLLLAACCFVVFAQGRAQAEPYLVVREGAKCNDCHTNLTGGGKRTAFAQIHAHDILHDLDLIPLPPGTKGFNGQIMSFVSIGADLRVRNTTVFEDQPNANGRVPENKVFRKDTTSNDIAVNEFLTYLQVDLFPDRLLLYAAEDFSSGAVNREAFALLYGLPWNGYLKAGRLYPTYGLRVQDDQAYIRDRTGYTFATPGEGGEIGIMPGPFALATSITNGVAGDKDIAVTVNGYTMLTELPVVRTLWLGSSFARQSDKRDIAAWYVGTNFWKFTMLGEFDKFFDRTVASEGKRDDYASYAELDFLLFDWLNLRGTFEYVKVSGDQNRTRYTVGSEPFISRYLQPRIQYRINNGPGSDPSANKDELWVELHLFF